MDCHINHFFIQLCHFNQNSVHCLISSGVSTHCSSLGSIAGWGIIMWIYSSKYNIYWRGTLGRRKWEKISRRIRAGETIFISFLFGGPRSSDSGRYHPAFSLVEVSTQSPFFRNTLLLDHRGFSLVLSRFGNCLVQRSSLVRMSCFCIYIYQMLCVGVGGMV